MKPELIIFDFDGTLADTTATILTTYNKTIEALDAPSRSADECRATIGLPLKEGFRQLFPDFTEEQLEACVKTYRSIYSAGKKSLVPSLYPGVKATLERLAEMGIRMSVASSRSRESLGEFCHETGIDTYFSLILGADDVMHAKPDPEPVLITLEKLGQNAARTIVVGDMPVDIAMGKDAGCRTVGVTYGNSCKRDLVRAGASYVIDSFPDLIETVVSKK